MFLDHTINMFINKLNINITLYIYITTHIDNNIPNNSNHKFSLNLAYFKSVLLYLSIG